MISAMSFTISNACITIGVAFYMTVVSGLNSAGAIHAHSTSKDYM